MTLWRFTIQSVLPLTAGKMILKNETQGNAVEETAALAQSLQVNDNISDIWMHIKIQYVCKGTFM